MREHDVPHGGRTLHVYEDGDPRGLPTFSHHGTPGCGLPYPPVADDARKRGLRVLSIDRPGYGGSTRRPGRSVADVAADVAAVADAPGLNYFAGMGRDNWEEFGAALQGREAVEALLTRLAAEMSGSDVDDMLAVMETLLGDEDRAALDRPMVAWLAEGSKLALGPGPGGWADDDLAFVAPWGFELAGIAVPVLVQHGRGDRFVPVAHGEWLGRAIPGADVEILARDGHLSTVRLAGRIHQWVLDQAG